MVVGTRAFAVAILFALAAACGSGGNDAEQAVEQMPQATLTAEEEAYLAEVERVSSIIDEQFAHFGAIISQSYPTRGALFAALREAGAGTAFDAGVEALEALAPPERLRADHERAVASLRESQRIDREIGQAVQDENLVAFVLANSQLDVLAAERALELSPAFCVALHANPMNPFRHYCDRPELAPDDEYARELHGVMRGFESEVRATGVTLERALSPEEVLEVTTALGPEAIAGIDRARRAIEDLDPPTELASDHARLVDYFDTLLEEVRALVAAAEEGDYSAYLDRVTGLADVFCGPRHLTGH